MESHRPACRGLAAACALALAFPAAASAERVTISRDSHGEPHIHARTVRGASYGFAWAQMQDQAPYVLTFIAHANGRSAAVIGPDCQPSLPACFRNDQLAHLFRVPETARRGWARLDARTRLRLRAFARGIDDYIDTHAANLPAWAAHVTGRDVLAAVSYGFVMGQVSAAAGILAGAGGDDDAAERSARRALSAAPDYRLPASNMFAITGRKTASGKPIVQGDPHLPFDGNNRWYAAQLVYGRYRVQGVTFRGLPGIAIGDNGQVAWSHTANQNAQHEQDLYAEKLNPADPNQYLYGGAYRTMKVRTLTLGVKLGDGSVRPVTVRQRATLHGPVLSDPFATIAGTQGAPGKDTAIAAKVSLYRQFTLAAQVFRESEARSVAQFRAAQRLNQLSEFNTIVADRRGHLFFVAGSRSGILKEGVTPNSLLDGSNPDTSWQGILPYDRLPHASDPASGYFENANNVPELTAPDQIHAEDIPFYLRGAPGGGDTSRSRRLIQLLGSQTSPSAPFGLTLADADRFGLDTYLEFGPGLRALLDQAADDPGADAKVKAGRKLVDAWPNAQDLHATVGASAYPLFATWRRGLRPGVIGFNPTNPPPLGTTFTARQKAEARRAMDVAYDGMAGAYGGTIAIYYGNLHKFTWGSLKGGVSGGDDDLATLRMTDCKSDPDAHSPVYYHLCNVQGGSSYVFNADLAADRFEVMRPVSDQDDPASPFYTKNAADYVADRYREFPITNQATRAEETSRLVLHTP